MRVRYVRRILSPLWNFNYHSILRRTWWRRGSSLLQGRLYKLLHRIPSQAENMWNYGYDDTAWLTADIARDLEELGLHPQVNKYALSLYRFIFQKFSAQIDGTPSLIELSAGSGIGYRFVKYLMKSGHSGPARTSFSDIVFREGPYDGLREEFVLVDVNKPETYESGRRFDIIYSVENFHVIADYATVFRAYSGLSHRGSQIHYLDIFSPQSLKDFVRSARECRFTIRECINVTARVNDSLLQQSLIPRNWNYLNPVGLGAGRARGEFYLYFHLLREDPS